MISAEFERILTLEDKLKKRIDELERRVAEIERRLMLLDERDIPSRT